MRPHGVVSIEVPARVERAGACEKGGVQLRALDQSQQATSMPQRQPHGMRHHKGSAHHFCSLVPLPPLGLQRQPDRELRL